MLALDIALRTGGIIINADSMQVYRDLRIITARPAPQEEAQATHRIYGHVDAGAPYSAGHWLEDARLALAEADARDVPALFVGGTGLYFKLLTAGIAPVPPVPAAIRDALRRRVAEEGAPALHEELARRDPPSAARLASHDRSRILRALEVLEATGRPLRVWHGENAAPLLPPQRLVRLFLAPERAVLQSHIATRFDAMLAAGALEEVRALAARRLDPLRPAMKAHGVPWLLAHLRGAMTLQEAAARAKADTQHYAKRQFTWFRNQMADWPWVPPHAASTALQAMLT